MCLASVTLTRRIAGHVYQNTVPCNKCIECCKDQQNEYLIRTIEEQKKRGSMVFFTLTYSPEALPMTDEYECDEESGEILDTKEVQTLRRKDVRDWKRIFQERYRRKGKVLDYGFLVCGEYGPKTKRPHYHGIFLGLDKDIVDEMMQYWQNHYGFVVYKWIPSIAADIEKVSRYCSKYIIKPQQWKLMPSPVCEKPRKMTSQHYGEPAPSVWNKWVSYYTCQDLYQYDIRFPRLKQDKLDRLLQEIIKRRKYDYYGKEFKLPNYYKRKIFYYRDATGKVRASQVQRLATKALQDKYDEDYRTKLRELATTHGYGTLDETVRAYNDIQAASLASRKARYEKDMQQYYLKAKV